MELTEDELIQEIRRLLSGEEPGVVVGLGDDAAVVESGSGASVLTTDMLIEGVHFERDAISPRDLGAKAIVVNVSDMAAMAASPRYALVSIGLTPDVEAAWVVELYGGMRAACDEYALALVGGDTNRSPAIVLSVTVVGEVTPRRAVTRSGAQPGDVIVVTGALGAPAGGLVLSRVEPARAAVCLSEPWGRDLVDSLARPVARVGEGQTLAQAGATAMMDLSDGLAKDLGRLCLASGVGARVELDRVPVAGSLRAGAATLGVDPLELAIGGGEDYELLATIDTTAVERARSELDDRFGTRLTEIGMVVDREGLVAVDSEGRTRPLELSGWDHFGRG
ncbi:MAG TPA: thiamine-phosphate kinase [Actinomycetota bacterium]|nr:thiamine-phosphate kinase [Actinomycetota bacterium]